MARLSQTARKRKADLERAAAEAAAAAAGPSEPVSEEDLKQLALGLLTLMDAASDSNATSDFAEAATTFNGTMAAMHATGIPAASGSFRTVMLPQINGMAKTLGHLHTVFYPDLEFVNEHGEFDDDEQAEKIIKIAMPHAAHCMCDALELCFKRILADYSPAMSAEEVQKCILDKVPKDFVKQLSSEFAKNAHDAITPEVTTQLLAIAFPDVEGSPSQELVESVACFLEYIFVELVDVVGNFRSNPDYQSTFFLPERGSLPPPVPDNFACFLTPVDLFQAVQADEALKEVFPELCLPSDAPNKVDMDYAPVHASLAPAISPFDVLALTEFTRFLAQHAASSSDDTMPSFYATRDNQEEEQEEVWFPNVLASYGNQQNCLSATLAQVALAIQGSLLLTEAPHVKNDDWWVSDDRVPNMASRLVLTAIFNDKNHDLESLVRACGVPPATDAEAMARWLDQGCKPAVETKRARAEPVGPMFPPRQVPGLKPLAELPPRPDGGYRLMLDELDVSGWNSAFEPFFSSDPTIPLPLVLKLQSNLEPVTNHWSFTPLIYHAALGNTEKVQALLQASFCDVNAQTCCAENGDGFGEDEYANYSALHFAASLGHYDIARALLDAGANPFQKCGWDGGPVFPTYDEETKSFIQPEYAYFSSNTPLHMAARAGDARMCALLISYMGTNFDIDLGGGNTPLFFAIAARSRDAASVLVQCNAKVSAIKHLPEWADTIVDIQGSTGDLPPK